MVRDAGIIIASQKVEHYEIAAYGSLVALAKKMGIKKAAGILEQTLQEEKKTDSDLTKLAKSAPENPGVPRAITEAEQFLSRGTLRICTRKISSRPLISGKGTVT